MKYNTVTLGQIEAMINKLGGESGMQDFLAGRMEVVKRKFHQFGDDLLKGKGSFTIPTDYNHDTQVDVFGKKANKFKFIYFLNAVSQLMQYGVEKARKFKSTYYYNNKITSKNFSKATNKLVPGKTYAIKMFPISETVQSEDCIAFLKENNAILFGAQGLTALQTDQPEIFPAGKCTVSFDEKDALWKDAGGDLRVPFVDRDSGGDWGFRLGYFEDSWSSGRVLVCFCDLDQPSDA
jgi:stalled ribosome alternative rescue factor ArfA